MQFLFGMATKSRERFYTARDMDTFDEDLSQMVHVTLSSQSIVDDTFGIKAVRANWRGGGGGGAGGGEDSN